MEPLHQLEYDSDQYDSDQEQMPAWLPILIPYSVAMANVLLIAALLWRVFTHYPENHWAIDWGWFWTWCVIAGCMVSWNCCVHRPVRATIVGILSIVLLVTTIWLLDHYSLLLPYRVWVKSGMPGPWHVR